MFATLAVQEKQPERTVALAAAAAALRESAGVSPLPAARTAKYLAWRVTWVNPPLPGSGRKA